MVQGEEHFGGAHAVDEVVGGDDDIVAGVAFAHFGEEFGVVAEEVHFDLNAGFGFEVGEGGFADVGVPVVEVQQRLLGGEGAVREGQADSGDSGGADGGEERAARAAKARTRDDGFHDVGGHWILLLNVGCGFGRRRSTGAGAVSLKIKRRKTTRTRRWR